MGSCNVRLLDVRGYACVLNCRGVELTEGWVFF